MTEGERLRADLLARRKFADGFERQAINRMLLYIEHQEGGTPSLSDDDVLALLDRRPGLVFRWCERAGFGFNGGQQKKIRGLTGG